MKRAAPSIYIAVCWLCVAILTGSCRFHGKENTAQYIFLGHTYTVDREGQHVNQYVEKLELNDYDLALLGGDITLQTTAEYETLYYVDSIFDLGNPRTHWAVGNHDYSHPEYISDFTKRPLFYAFYKKGITFILFDSQRDSCKIVGEQLSLLKNVVDSIEKSSHLLIIQHKMVWLYGHSELEKMSGMANGGLGTESWSVFPNNFHSEIYPLLLKVKKRGVDVICISGDLGINAKEFQYKTDDGIWFLASGLNRHDDENNKALVLTHDARKMSLSWKFVFLHEL